MDSSFFHTISFVASCSDRENQVYEFVIKYSEFAA